jgi:hypothetical protein
VLSLYNGGGVVRPISCTMLAYAGVFVDRLSTLVGIGSRIDETKFAEC